MIFRVTQSDMLVLFLIMGRLCSEKIKVFHFGAPLLFITFFFLDIKGKTFALFIDIQQWRLAGRLKEVRVEPWEPGN